MTTSKKFPRVLSTLSLALAACLLLFAGGTASAASPVTKDGRIHACYKAKGKGKGALRVAQGGKARCPRKWRKISWQATPVPGPRGQAGAPGTSQVQDLEGRVSQLLTRVEALEGVLKGITNQELLVAVDLSPVVQALCTRTSVLTSQVNLLEGVLGGLSLNGVLTTLGGLLNVPSLPGPLPAFSCPSP